MKTCEPVHVAKYEKGWERTLRSTQRFQTQKSGWGGEGHADRVGTWRRSFPLRLGIRHCGQGHRCTQTAAGSQENSLRPDPPTAGRNVPPSKQHTHRGWLIHGQLCQRNKVQRHTGTRKSSPFLVWPSVSPVTLHRQSLTPGQLAEQKYKHHVNRNINKS